MPNGDEFLSVVVSRQTKKAVSLRPLRLCGDFLNELAVRRYALSAMRFAVP